MTNKISQKDRLEAMDSIEQLGEYLNGLRNKLIAGGWNKERAEIAVISTLNNSAVADEGDQ